MVIMTETVGPSSPREDPRITEPTTLDEAISVIHEAKIADGTHYCGTFKDPRNGCEEWREAETILGYLTDAGILTLQGQKAAESDDDGSAS